MNHLSHTFATRTSSCTRTSLSASRLLLMALLCASGTVVKAQDVPPNTGSCSSCNRDANYLIISDTTQNAVGVPLVIPSGGLPAFVVPSSTSGQFWAGDTANGVQGTGGAWIAPAANEGNLSTPSRAGVTAYQLTFFVTDASKANLEISMAADDFLVVTLANSSTGMAPVTIFTDAASAMYAFTVNGVLSQTFTSFTTTPATKPTTTGLALGTNILVFTVTNGGPGPTGLSVAFHGSLGGSRVSGVPENPATHSTPAVVEPVDGATGQLYDTATDLELGGPLSFQFSRYYSSALSGTGFSSSLGLNWMTNFDVSAGVIGSTAKVLMFGGKVVTFNNTGSTWQLQSPLDIGYQFAASGGGYKFMDPNSRLIYTFSSAGSLTRMEDRNGNAITVTPGAFGPTLISDGAGRTLTLIYTNGQLAAVTDQGGRTFSYGFNGVQLLTSTDDAGKVTKYNYTPVSGLLVNKQLPLGNSPTTQAYDASGRVISQTDGNKNVTTITYDGAGNTTVTNPVGAIKKLTFDTNGDLTAQSDPAGAAKMTLDAGNHLTGVTDRVGAATVITNHSPTGRLASVTDALGNSTAYSYTAQLQDVFTFYNETGISYPDGTSEAFTYDATGNVLTHTAQDGSITALSYNASGQLLTTTDAKKGVTTFTWNQDATIATQTDPLGNQVAYGYDSLKRLVKVTDPNGGVSTFGYAIAGDGSHVTFGQAAGLGSTTQYYDFNGQPQDRVNELAGVYHATYTNTENISTLTDPLANKTTWTYNKADQVSSVTDQTFLAVGFNYDSAGHLTSMDNPNGTLATFGYTPEGRIASTTDGTGNKTSFTYDSLGRGTGVTSATGSKTAFGYDKLGNLISSTDPLGAVQSRTLDALGRTTQVTVPGGLTTSFTRDALGNPTGFTTANGNKWTSQFDALGRLANLTDPLGNAINYIYAGTQLAQIKTPLGVEALVTDKAGHVTKRAYADGTVINTGYDASGRIISADNLTLKRDVKGQPTNVNGIAITYDGAGRPATLAYTSGRTITYAYNVAGKVSSVVDWVGGKTTFGYDAAGRLTTTTYPNGAINTYSYDANAFLVKIGFGSLGSITLTRDAAGKITAADRSVLLSPSVAETTSQQFAYDGAAQLTSATYDALGRVTAQSGRKYMWNQASQLTSFADGSNSPSFTYDGLETINSMTTGGTTRSFLYNYLLPYPALSIVRQNGSDLRYYIYTPDGLLLYSIEAADSSRLFYHFDEMGNTVMLSNGNGLASDGYAITPYGEIASHSGTADNPFTWQGQYGVFQEGTALFNVRNRHYDASTARFVSRDPVMSADPRSSEPYAYASGNPLLYTDPFGTSIATNKCKPSTAVIIAVLSKGVQGVAPLDVYNFVTCEISNGYIKTGNFIVDGLVDEFDAAVKNKNTISWQGLAKALNVDNNDPQPIYDLLNGLIQAAITKANTPVKAPIAVITPPATPPKPVNPPEPCTAQPTPTVVTPPSPVAVVPASTPTTPAQIAAFCSLAPANYQNCLTGFGFSQAVFGLAADAHQLGYGN